MSDIHSCFRWRKLFNSSVQFWKGVSVYILWTCDCLFYIYISVCHCASSSTRNFLNWYIFLKQCTNVGRNSSFGIVSRYKVEAPWIKSRWGKIFCSHPDRPWGPHSLLYNGYWVSFLGVKHPGCGVNYTPPSSAEVKEGVELYLYSPSWHSWPAVGWNLPEPTYKNHAIRGYPTFLLPMSCHHFW
jgi:hypothetical protein